MFAQGEIVFNNRITNALIAPVFDVEPSNPFLTNHGNTASGTPAGTQIYNGAPLAGTNFTAQLFGGTTNTPSENLTPLSPATTFRTTNSAGFIVAPGNAVSVPGVLDGQPAKIQLRSWQNFGGTITNWQQVLANPNIPRGESLPFISPPLGGLFIAPPNLIGLQSFNLALPSTAALEFVSSTYLTNGNFQLGFTAATNFAYTLQASVDLTNWVAVATNIFVPSSPWIFEDTNAAAFSNRFYRLRWP
ncbi:MAG: hypothetical protein ABIR24_02830 [Verrucomicrobiota bacterium]